MSGASRNAAIAALTAAACVIGPMWPIPGSSRTRRARQRPRELAHHVELGRLGPLAGEDQRRRRDRRVAARLVRSTDSVVTSCDIFQATSRNARRVSSASARHAPGPCHQSTKRSSQPSSTAPASGRYSPRPRDRLAHGGVLGLVEEAERDRLVHCDPLHQLRPRQRELQRQEAAVRVADDVHRLGQELREHRHVLLEVERLAIRPPRRGAVPDQIRRDHAVARRELLAEPAPLPRGEAAAVDEEDRGHARSSAARGVIRSAASPPAIAAPAANHQPPTSGFADPAAAVRPAIATSALVPSARPSWRDMLTIALPVDAWCAGRPRVAAAKIDGNVSPTPTPHTSHAGSAPPAYERLPIVANRSAPAAIADAPSAAIAPTGNRRASRWPTIAKIGTMHGPGAIAKPVASTDQRQRLLQEQHDRDQLDRERHRDEQHGGVRPRERRVAEHREIDDRRRVARGAAEEARERRGGDHPARAGHRRPPAQLRHLDEPEHERADPDDEEQPARQIGPPPRWLARVAGIHRAAATHAATPIGRFTEEDPPPRGRDEQPAEDRAGGTRERAAGRPDPHRAPARRRRQDRQHEAEARRRQHGAAERLEAAERDERPQARARRARDAREREHRKPDEECLLLAKTVGEPRRARAARRRGSCTRSGSSSGPTAARGRSPRRMSTSATLTMNISSAAMNTAAHSTTSAAVGRGAIGPAADRRRAAARAGRHSRRRASHELAHQQFTRSRTIRRDAEQRVRSLAIRLAARERQRAYQLGEHRAREHLGVGVHERREVPGQALDQRACRRRTRPGSRRGPGQVARQRRHRAPAAARSRCAAER